MSETHTELEKVIQQNASGPKSAEVDGQKMEQHSLSDQIAADEYLSKKRAMRRKGCGLKITKLEHSGA